MNLEWENANKELNEIYESWGKQLKGLNGDEIDFSSRIYSKPYYISIPEKWFEKDMVRVMIVGQEGRGNWDKDGWRDLQPEILADIEKIKEWHKDYLASQLEKKPFNKYAYNGGRFWERFRKINALENCVCCWNNLDKIHLNKSKGCALTDEQRIKLHSTEIKILRKEIEILKPHIIIFFGYSKRESAIKAEFSGEFSSVAEKFYGEEGKDCIKLFNEKIYQVLDNNITYLFTQHPSFRPKEYEEKVLRVVKQAINKY